MANPATAATSLPVRRTPRELEPTPLLGTRGCGQADQIKQRLGELLETYWAGRRSESQEPRLLQIDEYHVVNRSDQALRARIGKGLA